MKLGIGIDNLPIQIRTSKVLTGNDLGMLANVEAIPTIDLSYSFNGNNHCNN